MTEAHIYRQKLALLVLDVLAFVVAFVVAMHLRFTANLSIFEFGLPPWEPMLYALPFILGAWLLTLLTSGLYKVERNRLFIEFAWLIRGLLVFVGVLLSATFFYRGFSYSRGFAILFLGLLLGLTFFGRIAFRIIRKRIENLDDFKRRVLLVGRSHAAERLIESSRVPDSQVEVVGLLDANDDSPMLGVPVLGSVDSLSELVKTHGVNGVIVTDTGLDKETQIRLLDRCIGANLQFQVVPSPYELMMDRVQIDLIDGVPVLGLRLCNIRGSNRVFKRAFDIIVATTALVLLSPLMLIVAALIKLTSKGPIFFTQDRVGESGRLFSFYKFRSMHVNNDDAIHREYVQKFITQGDAHEVDSEGALYKIKNDPRLIPIGAFIRKYSVDELPQLLNVLKGDMSLIGPRPPIPYEVEVYREWHKRRFEGPPGITGLWQVSGRNRLTFEEMVKLDIDYLENWSMGRDLLILWRTIGVVLFDRAY